MYDEYLTVFQTLTFSTFDLFGLWPLQKEADKENADFNKDTTKKQVSDNEPKKDYLEVRIFFY